MSGYLILKRLLDIILGLIFLLSALVPMSVIALFILIFDGRPIIFKQIRIGYNQELFVCYKFRTMSLEAPSNLSTKDFIDSEKYVTRIGRFLRSTSLDELPQLINVIRGDMSLVGPRPLIPDERCVHKERSRLGVYNVRPGMTGLSQICGRDNMSEIRKAECDAVYVKNISLQNDTKILISTLKKVIDKSGNNDCMR